MNKLIKFINNKTNTFKFVKEQYENLEIEYTRYIIYKNIITQIEDLFYLSDKKKYENKNIIDRFILECINHGITPHIENNINFNDTINIDDNLLYNKIQSQYLFFNIILENKHNNEMNNTSYYKKMINEYNEKSFKLTPDIILKIDNIFINSHNYFIYILKKIKLQSINSLQYALITLTNNEYFIIKYREYTKILSMNRYYKLLKNYDKPYPYDILFMLLRYSIFDMSSQQWSIGDSLYEDITDIFNISFELFSSPLNFNMNTFCSLFHDSDHIFGSIGSFYNLKIEKLLIQNIKGVFFNPPYLPILMNNCITRCINILNEMNKLNIEFTIVSFLPNWSDAEYIKYFINSKYVISYKVINKGNYILHEKDKGKLMNGSFDLLVIVLNSMNSTWNLEKQVIANNGVDKIINIMKQERKTTYINI